MNYKPLPVQEQNCGDLLKPEACLGFKNSLSEPTNLDKGMAFESNNFNSIKQQLFKCRTTSLFFTQSNERDQ